jgi:hypothetical protein
MPLCEISKCAKYSKHCRHTVKYYLVISLAITFIIAVKAQTANNFDNINNKLNGE